MTLPNKPKNINPVRQGELNSSEVQRFAGHSSIETTMKYYVSIRETMIGRARKASSAALGGDSIANSLQQGKKHQNGNNDDIAIAM